MGAQRASVAEKIHVKKEPSALHQYNTKDVLNSYQESKKILSLKVQGLPVLEEPSRKVPQNSF